MIFILCHLTFHLRWWSSKGPSRDFVKRKRDGSPVTNSMQGLLMLCKPSIDFNTALVNRSFFLVFDLIRNHGFLEREFGLWGPEKLMNHLRTYFEPPFNHSLIEPNLNLLKNKQHCFVRKSLKIYHCGALTTTSIGYHDMNSCHYSQHV